MAFAFETFDFTGGRKQAQDPKGPGLLGNVADTGLQLAQGVLQGGEMLANTFGADNQVSKTLRAGSEWLASNFSDQLKWEQLTTAQDMRAAELSGSTWEEIKAAARGFGRDPVGYLVNAAGTSIPTIAAAFLPGGQGAALGRLAALGMGSAQGAGAVKGQIYSEVKKAWEDAGRSPEEAEARAIAAQEYLGSNAGQIALGTALGALAGGTGVEAGILARKAGMLGQVAADAAATAPTSILGRAAARVPRFAREGIKEAIPEGAQGGQEQLASNLALQNEGFATETWQGVAGGATLEALAGGAFGAAASTLTRTPEARQANADQALADLGRATTVDEAINAATRAADVPVLPDGMDAAAENRVMTAMEGLAANDQNAIRFGSPNAPSVLRPLDQARQPEASATVTEAPPFGDRVLDLREQLADERTRQQIRDRLGPEALDTVSYYASVADRADINMPEKTRERLLTLAESIVSRALLQEIDRPGVGSAADTTPRIGAESGPARIGLDTSLTGAMRVDAAGNAAPETRADAINTRQASLRERVDGMTQQVDRRPLPRDFTLVGEGELTTPMRRERTEPAAQVQPEAGPLLLTADGFPYGTKSGATIRARREGLDADSVIEVPGGYAVRTMETPSVEPELPVTAAGIPGAGADGAGDAAAGAGAVGLVAADAERGGSADTAPAVIGSVGDLPAGDRGAGDGGALKTKSAVREGALRRGQVGDKFAAGEVAITASGRKTSPFPRVDTSTTGKANRTVERVNNWLMSNALREAELRDDDFNARQFRAVNWLNPTQADKDAAEEYLFGQQPSVMPSILKPLAPAKAPAATPPAVTEGTTTQGEADGTQRLQAQEEVRQEQAPRPEAGAEAPASSPAPDAEPLADRVDRRRQRTPTRTEPDQTQTAAAPSRKLIELRKREAVLPKLLACLNK